LTNAIDLEEKLRTMPTVADVEPPVSLLKDFLNSSNAEKLGLIGEIKQELAPLKFGTPDPSPVDMHAFSRTLYSLYGYLGAALDAVGNSDPELTKQFVALRQAIEEFAQDDVGRQPPGTDGACGQTGAVPAGALHRHARPRSSCCKTRMTARRCMWTICPRPFAINLWA
jgi:hypothetical protein